MPFPVLRTPFIVLSEIISLLEPKEIVIASFCSKNVKLLLKRHYQRRKPAEWTLWMTDYDVWGRVEIGKLHESLRNPVILAAPISRISELNGAGHKLIEMNGYKRGVISDFSVLYFEDLVLGTKMIVDYVTDLFNLGVHGLVTDMYGVWAIDFIYNRQENMLACVHFSRNSCNCAADEEFDHVLRNAHASDHYILAGNVTENFQFDGKLGPTRQLWINLYGHWVTLNNLINFDAREIVVRGSRLTVSDIDSFIRHWRAGGSTRLKFLKLELETDTDFEIFEDELEGVETDVVGEYRLGDGEEFDFDDGYNIQRNDGVKATIHFDIRHFIMMVEG